ncbi:cyclic nucleotide-binding domain-containing protein [Leptobacterium flavescens]|uniref:Cyclic nucleotide-binding domain-containing protein n=1 Tax=Leptobacterium flavescens TaxID=472055 RepID=A0A6P0ULV8_9FLAO|nr:Crp/Fnr family transcriptional regulator [Leptobacterium flavescens]NER12043.1 cyclic nucleotide-binding domain-containing protein [Leptobacterium flavescens]
MKNQLLEYISRYITLSEEERQAVIENIPVRTFKKGTVLLREGEISTECYFNLKGLVRQYYLVDGEEKTTFFYTEEQVIASLESATKKIPSKHYLVCEENTTLTIGTYETENEFYKRFPKFEQLSRILSGENFGEYQELFASFKTSSPEERYLDLLKNRPELIKRVPQYQLASYIGVSPESLSRIRKRIFQKK